MLRLFYVGLFFLGLASGAVAENITVADYKKTFDNIPASWEQFYLAPEQIALGQGRDVDQIFMTKHTYGQSDDGTKLAGGHWFTVIGENYVLLKDETGKTHLIETRKKCKSLRRAKYIFLPNNKVELDYRRLGSFAFTTRITEGFADCQITGLYEWNGPTYYIDNINRPVRNYIKRKNRRKIGQFTRD